MTSSKLIKFINCTLCDKGALKHNAELYIDQTTGTIVDPPARFDGEEVDLQGLILSPGFIDIQINGCYGFDFSHYESDDQYRKGYSECMAKLLRTGTTSICPTLVTSYPEVYAKVLPLVTKTRKQNICDSLGAHCEGPFISLKKKGCHPPECLQTAPQGFRSFQQVYGDDEFYKHLSIVTAAPEIEGVMDAIDEITSKGVVYSIGHTEAGYDISCEALRHGASMITHIYNAMPQPHHREPGVVGIIADPQVPHFGMVADGIHVHHAAAAMAYHTCPDKCVLVTDAMSWIGLPDGTYPWNEQFVVKEGPLLHLKGKDTIAGSATELPTCIQNLMKWCQISLAEAIKTVTNNPADSLNVQHKKGYLSAGCDADLTVLDFNGNVKQVYKLGSKVYDEQLKQHL